MAHSGLYNSLGQLSHSALAVVWKEYSRIIKIKIIIITKKKTLDWPRVLKTI